MPLFSSLGANKRKTNLKLAAAKLCRSQRPALSAPFSSFGSDSSESSSSGFTSTVQVDEETRTWLNAISFDAAGVTAAAQVRIIDIIMLDLGDILHAADHVIDRFHIFAGTGGGGLNALGYGSLFPFHDMIEVHRKLPRSLFRRQFKTLRKFLPGPRYEAARAKRCIDDVIKSWGPDLTRNTKMYIKRTWEHRFDRDMIVTAANAADPTGEPIVFRSWDPENKHTLSEVALATIAAPSLFPAKKLRTGEKATAVGDKLKNPTEVLFQETRKRYGRDVKFNVLLSLGGGTKTLKKGEKPPVDDVHERMKIRFEEGNLGLYVRINVPGLGDIAPDDYRALPEIIRMTNEYMDTPEMLTVRMNVVNEIVRMRRLEKLPPKMLE